MRAGAPPTLPHFQVRTARISTVYELHLRHKVRAGVGVLTASSQAYCVSGASGYCTHVSFRVCPPRLPAGHRLPQLVDLSWRLDYEMFSKEGGRAGKPMYTVILVLLDTLPNGLQFVQQRLMTCTPQELDHFRSTVKDALRAASLVAPK